MDGENTRLVLRHRDPRAPLSGRDSSIGFVMWTKARRHPDYDRRVYGCCICTLVDGWIRFVSFTG